MNTNALGNITEQKFQVIHQTGVSILALFWVLRCDSSGCDFHAVIGWTHELPNDIRLGFCSCCFQQIHIQEVWDRRDADFIEDVRVMRVMIPKDPAVIPSLGKNPRERRLKRKELGLPPVGRTTFRLERSSELFSSTGTHLYYELNGGVVPEIEQAPCPYCHANGGIVLGFSEDAPRCPKCNVGTIVSNSGTGT